MARLKRLPASKSHPLPAWSLWWERTMGTKILIQREDQWASWAGLRNSASGASRLPRVSDRIQWSPRARIVSLMAKVSAGTQAVNRDPHGRDRALSDGSSRLTDRPAALAGFPNRATSGTTERPSVLPADRISSCCLGSGGRSAVRTPPACSPHTGTRSASNARRWHGGASGYRQSSLCTVTGSLMPFRATVRASVARTRPVVAAMA